jgi:hypothetical protein
VTVITVTAHDASGNVVTDTLTVTVDSTVPHIEILQPTTTGAYSMNAGRLTVSGTAGDDIAVDHISFSLSGATTASGTVSGTTAWTMRPLFNEGVTVITVTAWDSNGHSSSASLTVDAAAAQGGGGGNGCGSGLGVLLVGILVLLGLRSFGERSIRP